MGGGARSIRTDSPVARNFRLKYRQNFARKRLKWQTEKISRKS
jgi:hypothetical protein